MIGLEKLILPSVLLVLVSGCASVTRGTKDTLVVESDPSGATVRLSTGASGKTPTSFQLPRKNALEVFIEKDGYEPLTVHVSSQISGTGAVGMAGNVLVGGLIGVGVDTWTGASKDLRPNPIKVTLVPRKKEDKPSQATEPTVTPSGLAATGQPEVVDNGAVPNANGKSSPPNDFKPAGVQVGILRLANEPDSARVQDMISGVLLARQWEVQEKANDHVVGHIKHRHSEAFLTLAFDSREIRLYCEGWKIDKKTGVHIKPELPDSWIENIRNDLTRRLNQASAVH